MRTKRDNRGMTNSKRNKLTLSAAVACASVCGAIGLPLTASGQEEERTPRRQVWMWDGVDWSGDRAVLGVSLDMELDADLDGRGVRVASVTPEGPAGEAGMQEGDIIVSLAGHDLGEALDDATERRFDDDRSFPGQRLVALMRDVTEGEPVEVVVERDGESVALSVTPQSWSEAFASYAPDFRLYMGRVMDDLRETRERMREHRRDALRHREDTQERRRARADSVAERVREEVGRLQFDFDRLLPEGVSGNRIFVTGRGMQGLEAIDLNPGLGAYFGTDEGVLITDVEEESQLSLRPGDVVVSIDGRSVDDLGELRRILASYRDEDEVEIGIWRDGRQTTVTGTIY